MFAPLPTPAEIAVWEKSTIEDFGLPGLVLMESASREALRVLQHHFGNLRGHSAILFAGPGNNGGDAFALARHLHNLDCKVLILHMKHKKEYTGECALQLAMIEQLGVACSYLPEYDIDLLPPIDIVVDGLFGTGLTGEIREDRLRWIKRVNRVGRNAFVLSLDIPSGINGVTGKPMPIAVKADVTVTFEEAKLGLFLPPAKEFTGELVIGKIGIPRFLKTKYPCKHVAITEKILQKIEAPNPTMYKGKAGHLLIIGGSTGLSGAPALTALGAFRSGVGLVTVASPEDLCPEIKNGFPEIMTLPLATGKKWNKECMETLAPHLEKFSSVVIGPGLGRSEGAHEFLREYMKTPHPRTIYDADALFFLAQDETLAAGLDINSIYTPHPGELAAFFDVTSEKINLSRITYATRFTERFPGTLVLKGAATIIASSQKEAPVYVSPFTTPSLAVGGSGDILAGIAGNLRGQGFSAIDTAAMAVYWHGLAGQKLLQDLPLRGNLASEIAHQLPFVIKEASHAHSK